MVLEREKRFLSTRAVLGAGKASFKSATVTPASCPDRVEEEKTFDAIRAASARALE